MKRALGLFVAAAWALASLHAWAGADAKRPSPTAKPSASSALPPVVPGQPASTKDMPPITQPPMPKGVTSNRHFVTLRGEIVDYYCYIEKGLRGPDHKACGVRCVAGDICMGLLTTEGDLYMISVNHLRAMDPRGFKGIPDPWNVCRGFIAESVDLSGYAMERKGQHLIEIMDVKKAAGPPPPRSH